MADRQNAVMLAVLGKEPPGAGWIFEPKFDGLRCLAIKRSGRVHLRSRNNKSLSSAFPEIVAAVDKLSSGDFIVDGEITATTFRKLQRRMQRKSPTPELLRSIPCHYHIFDLLASKGKSLRSRPLLERKQQLKRLKFGGRTHYVSHTKTFRIRRGFEGTIAKRADSKYLGRRSSDWRKYKGANREELLVCGYTDSDKAGRRFGALLLGIRRRGKLHYAGRVGTGFSRETQEQLMKRFARLRRSRPLFDISGAHWITPKLVADIAFTEWTNDGKLRHPSFLGLRIDKP